MSIIMNKPSRAEDEYFARQTLELRKKWARERAETLQNGEKAKLRELHFMKCPKCGMDLHTIELHGISVDQCGTCMGSWFDRGEVEQLLHPEHRGLFERVMSVFQ